MNAPLTTDEEMMARVLKGQEHLTIEQKLRNVCESFSIVQADNVRLYALADSQEDEIALLHKLLADQNERLLLVYESLTGQHRSTWPAATETGT